MSKLTALLSTTLSEIRLVKVSTLPENGKAQLKRIFNNRMRRETIESIFTPIMGGTITFIIMGVVGMGAYRVGQRSISSDKRFERFCYIYFKRRTNWSSK